MSGEREALDAKVMKTATELVEWWRDNAGKDKEYMARMDDQPRACGSSPGEGGGDAPEGRGEVG